MADVHPNLWDRLLLFARELADIPSLLAKLVNATIRGGPVAALQYSYDHLVRLATGAPPARFSRITDHVYVGGQQTAAGWQRLAARGVDSVVNLRAEFDDAAAGIAPERYLYLPTADNTPPTFADLCRGVAFLRAEAVSGRQVYVHCMLGVGRSATLAAAYLVADGLRPAEAWQYLLLRRPFIQPTASQMAAVEEFAARSAECEPVIPHELLILA
jgi:predicted protein tyrosine phosphatase